MAAENVPWSLQSFLDSLVVELDRAQDTLAVKALNRPLSYTVKDVALDLHVFPTYHQGDVRFSTARAGQTGASKISLTLGSITDRMVRETTPAPITEDEVDIEDMEQIDEDTKRSLLKVGVRSADDLERMRERNVDIRTATGGKLDYGNLASVINRARRGKRAPRVFSVAMTRKGSEHHLELAGENLALLGRGDDYPSAALDDELIPVTAATAGRIALSVDERQVERPRTLRVALDPYTVLQLELNPKRRGDA